LNAFTSVLLIGKGRHKALTEFGAITGVAAAPLVVSDLKDGEAVYWPVSAGQTPRKITWSAAGDENRAPTQNLRATNGAV